MDLLNRNYFFFKASGGAGRSSSPKAFKSYADKVTATNKSFKALAKQAKYIETNGKNLVGKARDKAFIKAGKLRKKYDAIRDTPISN